MITEIKAKELAQLKISEYEKLSRIKLVIMDDEKISFEFGWMFFYQSDEYYIFIR